MSYTKICPRGGTKYEWSTMNPVLSEREMAVEYPDSGIGTGLCRIKFGDGFKTYNELPYAFDAASASKLIGGNAAVGNLFQIRADSHENWIITNPVLEENEMVYDTSLNCFYVGDGVSRFSQLNPAGQQLIYDFGDEDEDTINSPYVPPTAGGASLHTEGGATLGDLMGLALGDVIDPVPIDGGEPLIVGGVSDEAPEETPVEEEPVVEETPIEEDVPVEDIPFEEAPAEEVPFEETPTDEPVEEVPVEEEPVEEAPIEEEPVAEPVVEEVPTEETPAETVEEPVEETTEDVPVEEPVAESTEETPVEEPVAETTEETPVEEAPAEETVVDEEIPVEETVEEDNIDKEVTE